MKTELSASRKDGEHRTTHFGHLGEQRHGVSVFGLCGSCHPERIVLDASHPSPRQDAGRMSCKCRQGPDLPVGSWDTHRIAFLE